ncbi:MAG: hypothetical protein WKF47_06190 [Geodermatophilaceae bacterium]
MPAGSVLVDGRQDRGGGSGPRSPRQQMRGRSSLPGQTLLPGMIEGHSHMFLHPYNETSWNDQVIDESLALRTARATVHARKTLEAGFTTARDLGTEGAGYADVGLKQAIDSRDRSRVRDCSSRRARSSRPAATGRSSRRTSMCRKARRRRAAWMK